MDQKAKKTNEASRAKNLVSRTQKNDPAQLINSPVDHIPFLQHVFGNKMVQRLVQTNFKSRFAQVQAKKSVPEAQKHLLSLQHLLGNKAVQRQVLQTKNDRPKTPEEQLRDELDDIFVDEAACLRYIGQLDPATMTRVKKDKWMLGRMARAFNAREMMEAIQRLMLELKWAIYWLDRAGEADNIGNKGYDTLISAATAGDVARLIGWKGALNVVKDNYAGNPLTMFPPLVADNPMLVHVFGAYRHYINWILEYPGAQQLLRFLVKHNPSGMIDALDKSGRWTPFLNKLPKGMGLMPPDKTALFTLFNSTKDVNKQVKLFEIRFNVEAKSGTTWQPKGLKRTWEMLNMLPASDVEGNPNLKKIYRGGKGATKGLATQWASGKAHVGYWYEEANLKQKDVGVYSDPADIMYNMNIFDGVVIHEIGHTVDGYEGKFSKKYCPTVPGGGWRWHTAQTAVDAMIAASPWPSSKAWTNAIKGKARQACINTATSHTKVETEANALDKKGNLWNMIKNQQVAQAIEPAFSTEAPWMNHGAQKKFGNRYYHESDPGEWFSYLSARYDAKLSKYQFKNPGDWFAETYTCYYITVDPSNPQSKDAGKNVPEPIKTWFRQNVARTTPPPGAKKAGP